MAVVSDGSYNVPKSLVYSYPVSCHNGEWKIVQGLAGAELPVLDMTKDQTEPLIPQTFGPTTIDREAIKSVGDPNKLFTREREGWTG